MRRAAFRYIKRSFSLRLILVFVGITLCSALALNCYFYSKARQRLQTDLFRHGRSLTTILATISRLGVFAGSKDDLQEPARSIYQDEYCKRVLIYDWQGTLLSSLGEDQDGKKEEDAGLARYEQISKSPDPSTTFYPEHSSIVVSQAIFPGETYSDDDLFFSSKKPYLASQAGQQPIGYVVVTFSTEKLESKARTILINNLIATLVVVLTSSICILLLVNRMTKPIQSLAREIVKHRPSKNDGNDLTDSLGDFGAMIDIIKNSYRTISELKDNLEEKVRERTADLFESNTALRQHRIALEQANSELTNALEELKLTQDQLIQSEKMAALGQLVGGLSHEINNALNFITGALPLLDRNLKSMGSLAISATGNPEKSDQQRLIERNETLFNNIKEGVRRIVELTRNLRVFSYNNPHDLSRENIHMGLSASIGIVQSKYGKRIVIEEQFASDLPEISCNIGQLNQVFMNLLMNAAQAIHQEGTITVRTSFDKKEMRIAICDTGEGIPQEQLGEVFNPFYTTKKIGEGTGLGLSISYTIITRHGGKIDIFSKPGRGTTFEITLPL